MILAKIDGSASRCRAIPVVCVRAWQTDTQCKQRQARLNLAIEGTNAASWRKIDAVRVGQAFESHSLAVSCLI